VPTRHRIDAIGTSPHMPEYRARTPCGARPRSMGADHWPVVMPIPPSSPTQRP